VVNIQDAMRNVEKAETASKKINVEAGVVNTEVGFCKIRYDRIRYDRI
jgi:hypothetical protein